MKETNNRNTSRNANRNTVRSNTRGSQLSGDERIVNRTNQRRKKNRRKKLIIRAVLLLIFTLAGIILALTMFFNINEITVTGDNVYSKDAVIEKSGVTVGDNLIFLSKSKIEEKLTEELPYIGSVKIKRRLPSKLELIITKTEATYALVSDGCYTLLDEDCKVLEKDLEYIGENIILLNIGEVLQADIGKTVVLKSEKNLEKLMDVRKAYKECGIDSITSIDLSDIYDIKLVYQGRIILELGETDSSNLSKKLSLGKAALDTQNEENELYRGTINLTVEGKGYWAEETSTTEPESTTEAESTEKDSENQENDKKEEPATAAAA